MVKNRKKPVRTNLILIRKTEMKKVLIMVYPLKPQDFSDDMTILVFSQILMIAQQKFICMDP